MEIYIENDEFDKMFDLCVRYGEKQPILWRRIFSYCASHPSKYNLT
jgi:hypothetical protein